MITVGSLFAGIGGLELGLEMTGGFETVWQVENDEHAQKVLAKHWPNVGRWDDVRTFPPPPVDDWRCDLICGGFPCKQTSTIAAVHGRRNGLQGKDSGLWFPMLHALQILRPRWVLVENVGGAQSWNTEIKGGLADIGYRVPDRPLEMPASVVGAPHSRRRLFWLADFDGKGLAITRQGGPSKAEVHERRTDNRNPWLSNLAGVCRMADGVPGGLERRKRIECLGNAVVPQVAQWIGQRILEAEGGLTAMRQIARMADEVTA